MKTTPKKLLVAVSGGVDSVVLLDILARTDNEIVVAHFEHGIRGHESRNDAEFVLLLSKKYGYECMIGHGDLTQNASEEMARNARYEFLRAEAKKRGALLVTAHHLDDYIGSVLINLHRGTGWRGLAVMNANDIVRPLKNYTKAEIFDYAITRKLEYVEDATNRDRAYLRNRLKANVMTLSHDQKTTLLELIEAQKDMATRIDEAARSLLITRTASDDFDRYFLMMINEATALQLLQTWFRDSLDNLPWPTVRRLLFVLKTARPGTRHDITTGHQLKITKTGAKVV